MNRNYLIALVAINLIAIAQQETRAQGYGWFPNVVPVKPVPRRPVVTRKGNDIVSVTIDTIGKVVNQAMGMFDIILHNPTGSRRNGGLKPEEALLLLKERVDRMIDDAMDEITSKKTLRLSGF